ncbi:formate dehydrogenase accessory sulfurtransferase FdhD [Halobacillus shinanisalinarum]|uniref:Sulfur carrier protein FdhD n=1 Tax=Halobacillus shinanisalinarum TaxID=2932258 RepID=A0ABY4GYK4_9BACI|nr:formate dehydrogenase accessory sulfurtransferase FdhD [Halobacillus shinanisalinarum]UOQ92954.1 formate dehydrogenase accessory sulfurtransferase FdhD [Halobacillus shinanisalinarum]
MRKGTTEKDMIKYDHGLLIEESDQVAEEYPLTIVLNDEEFATMVCTPMHLEELVIGFLASEGAIRTIADVDSISIDEERGFAYITTNVTFEKVDTTRRWIGSCCGKSRAFYFQNDAKIAKTVMDEMKIEPEFCLTLMEAFQKKADMFKKTGGVHQAAIASTQGVEIVFNDIGRHNALDKLYGYLLKQHLSRKHKIIIFSGRISSEVLLKVSKMGIGFLLSKSAPTDLALKLAEDLNITAVGFVRGKRMNIYTHAKRLAIHQE